jgi:hypothetical protein
MPRLIPHRPWHHDLQTAVLLIAVAVLLALALIGWFKGW